MAGSCKWAVAASIIAAAINALSDITGKAISAKNNRDAAEEREKYLSRRRREEQDWYDRNYKEDPTMRADAQRAINIISEELKNRNRATAGRAAMGGATEEAVAQEKALGNQALADVIGGIAAEGSKRKDAVDAMHHQAMQNIDDTAFGMQEAENARKAQNLQTAMASAGSLASAIASSNSPESETKKDTAPATPSIMNAGEMQDSPAGSKDAKTQLSTHKPSDYFEQPHLA